MIALTLHALALKIASRTSKTLTAATLAVGCLLATGDLHAQSAPQGGLQVLSSNQTRSFSYQARISQNGSLLSDGQHVISLKLYSEPNGGTPIFSEDQQITSREGIINIEIGASTPLPSNFGSDTAYYLGLSLDASPELTPRTHLTAAPLALHANVADYARNIAPDAKGAVTSINEMSGPLHIEGDSSLSVSIVNGSIKLSAVSSGLRQIVPLDNSIIVATSAPGSAAISVRDSGITSQKLALNSVTTGAVADGALTLPKLAPTNAAAGSVLTWDGTKWIPGPPSVSNKIVGGLGIRVSGDTITSLFPPPEGFTQNSTLRFNGKSWVENNKLLSDAQGNTSVKGRLTVGDSMRLTSLTKGVMHSLADGTVQTGSVDAASEMTGTLAVTNGGTGVSTLATNEVLIGNGNAGIQSVKLGDGEMLVGQASGLPPHGAKLTAGTGISITNNTNGLTIAAPNSVSPGTQANTTLRWDGTAWVEDLAVQETAQGALTTQGDITSVGQITSQGALHALSGITTTDIAMTGKATSASTTAADAGNTLVTKDFVTSGLNIPVTADHVTISGTGVSTSPLAINLANSNTWTAAQSFSNGLALNTSTSPLSLNGSVGNNYDILVSSGPGATPLWRSLNSLLTSVSFDKITSGVNTNATMSVGTGASLTPSGTGIVAANQFVGSGSTSNAVDLETAEVNGVLPVSNGGTGVPSLLQNSLVIGNGTQPVKFVSMGTGTLLMGQTGAAPIAGAITGSNGIVVTPGTSGINISMQKALPVGTAPNTTLHWDGSNWVENITVLTTTNGGINATTLNATSAALTGKATSASTLTSDPAGTLVTKDYVDNAQTSFDRIASGTNTTATMSVGSGARLGPVGSGIVNANEFVGPGSVTNMVDLGTAEVNGVLPVANGGTGATSFGAGELIVGNGTNALSTATLTGGPGVTVTNNAGAISVGITNALPSGSVNNSTLRWNGTAWTENTNVLTTATGDINVAGNSNTAGNAVVGGNATITGNATVNNNATINGNATVGGNAAVTGNVTVGANVSAASLTLSGKATSASTTSADPGTTLVTKDYLSSLTTSFDKVTSGSNTNQTLDVGNGSTLSPSGTGTIAANAFVGTGSTSSAVDLNTAEVAGVLPVTNGGTGAATLAQGGLLVGNGTSPVASVALGLNQVLVGGASLPTAANLVAGSGITITNAPGTITLTATGALPVGTASNTTLRWNGTGWVENTNVLESAAGSLSAGSISGTDLSVSGKATSASTTVADPGNTLVTKDYLGNLTTSFDKITAGINLGQSLTVGTGSSLSPSGTGSITATEFTGTGSTTNAVDLQTAEVAGTLPVSNGGTGATTLAANSILIGNGTSPVTTTSLTNGQVLIGATGLAPQAATLTAGTGVSITNAAGSVTIAATGGVSPGTTPNSTLRWNGTNWIENANVLSTATGNVSLSGKATSASTVTGDAGTTLVTKDYVDAASTSFDRITTGTNISAAMTVGSGASVAPSGTGSITATKFTGTGSTTNAVDLQTAEVAGTLPVTNGGTGATSLAANSILIGNGTSPVTSASLTNGQVLIGATGSAPQAATLTAGTGVSITNAAGSVTISATGGVAPGTTPNSTLRWNGTNWIENANVLSTATGNVSLSGKATSASTVSGDAGTTLVTKDYVDAAATSFDRITTGTNISAAMTVGSGASVAPSGTGSITATKFTGTGSTSNAVDLQTAEVAGTLPVSNGGTGATTLAANSILIGNGTSPVTSASLTNGQVLIGATGSAPQAATLTAGTGVSITNAAGSVTIAATAQPVVTNATLTGNGLAATPLAIDLTHANTWSAQQSFSNGLSLTGTTSPISLNGSTGTPNYVLTSQGAGATPIWQNANSLITGLSFDKITTGSNISAAMTVGSGASITPSGTGSITATQFTGTGSTTNAVDLQTAEVAGTLPVSNGGTGATSLAANSILIGNGTSPVTSASLTNGQVLIGATGSAPQAATLTAGTGVSITNAAGSVTIAATGGVSPGTTPNSTLRWNGTNWIENANVLSTSTGNLSLAGKATSASTVSGDAGTTLVTKDYVDAASTSFDRITTGTNISAAMTVGTGSSIAPSGTGSITATKFTGTGSTTSAVDLQTAEVAGTLPVSNGGTGATTLAANSILIGNGTSPVTSASLTNGQVLIGATGSAPQAATLTAGTGVSITNAAGSVTIAATALPVVTNATLTGNGLAATPLAIDLTHANAWSAQQSFSSGVALSGASSPLLLNGAVGTSGYVLTSQGAGVTPTWLNPNSLITSVPFSSITSATNLGQTLAVGNGSSITPTGTGLVIANAFAAPGSLTSAVDLATAEVNGVLAVPNGGTGTSSLTANSILIGNGTSPVTSAALTNGQVLIGSTGSAPVPATLSAGTGISITNTAGAITIASTSGGGWGLTGNSATSPGTNFIGTTDNQAFELHVYNGDAAGKGSKSVMRFEPTAESPNIISGYNGNTGYTGLLGGTLLGGGASGFTNRVTDNYGVVVGGKSNMAGDNSASVSNAQFATVGGGYSNNASGQYSVIPGGRSLTVGANSFGFNADNSGTQTDVSAMTGTAYFGNANVAIGNVDNTPRELRFYGPQTSASYVGSKYVALKAAPATTSTYTLPDSVAAVTGELMLSNTSGKMAWTDAMAWDNTHSRLGVGSTSAAGGPTVTLDVDGAVALRNYTVTVSATPVNNLWLNGHSMIRFEASSAFTVTGLEGGADGRIVVLFNATASSMTISNDDNNSMAPNRIWTKGGASLTVGSHGSVTLFYSDTDQRWVTMANN